VGRTPQAASAGGEKGGEGMDDIADLILFHNVRVRNIMKDWFKSMESESAEGFLDLLLKAMSLVFTLNAKGFRRNIEGFRGRYLFRSADDALTVSAVFDGGAMKVRKGKIDAADIIITFKDGKALMNFILSPKPDILGSMLRQDVSLEGNLNYLYKFAYMAKRLQLMAEGKV
jgi:hypothetical protein